MFVQTMWFMLNTCSCFESLECWYMPGKTCSCDQPLIQTLSIESLKKFPGRWRLMCCRNSLLEKLSTARVTLLRVGSWKLATGFLRTLSHILFLLLIFALSSFAVISHSHECIYILSLMTPLSESLNLGSGLRDPKYRHPTKEWKLKKFSHSKPS